MKDRKRDKQGRFAKENKPKPKPKSKKQQIAFAGIPKKRG